MISSGHEVTKKGRPLTSRHGGRAVYHTSCTPVAVEKMRVFKAALGQDLVGVRIEGTITPTEILGQLTQVSETKLSDVMRAARRYSLPSNKTGYEGVTPMENATLHCDEDFKGPLPPCLVNNDIEELLL